MRSPYTFSQRDKMKGNNTYSVRFWIESEHTYSNFKSTGQTSKAAAKAWCEDYLKRGPVVTSERAQFQAYAENFFASDGEYAITMKQKGKPIADASLRGHQAHPQSLILSITVIRTGIWSKYD